MILCRASEYASLLPNSLFQMAFVHIMRHRSKEDQSIHRAIAIPATAKRPAATEPIFFVAAPVKPAEPTDPVPDGPTGVMGDPVAPAPEPEPDPEAAPAPEPEPAPDPPTTAPDVPVAMGAVPVAKPVEPATPVELVESQLFTHSKIAQPDVCSSGMGFDEGMEFLPDGRGLSA